MMREMFGEDCLTRDQGERVYEIICPELHQGRKVTLDFFGVRVVASLFLNSAVGKLYGAIKPSKIRELLSIVGMTDIGKFTLRRVVESSKDYYGKKKYRRAVDHAVDAIEA